MMAASHMALGGAAWVVVVKLGGAAPELSAAGMGMAVLGSLLPDIDHPGSAVGRRLWMISRPLSMLIGHRGLTHSLLAVLAGVAALVLVAPSSDLAVFVAPLAVGYLSHLAADALTPSGVPLLWPVKRRFGIALCSTGGPAEMLTVAAVLGLAAWLAGPEALGIG